MKSILVLLLLVGILFVITQKVFAQFGPSSSAEQMMGHMRFTHSQLANNIDEVIQLVKSNNTAEAITWRNGD